METLKEMQDRWAIAMAATYTHGPRTGQRLYENDPKFAREVTALGVQIAEREATENARPQISPRQLEQLEWLDRVQGHADKDGNIVAREMSARATKFRTSMHNARQRVLEGHDISEMIETTERDLAAKGGTLPTTVAPPKQSRDLDGNLRGTAVLLPSMAQTPTLPQPINTLLGPKT